MLTKSAATAATLIVLLAELLQGYSAVGKSCKVHLDGSDLPPFLKGEAHADPCKEFLCRTDGGDLAALRYGQWKRPCRATRLFVDRSDCVRPRAA